MKNRNVASEDRLAWSLAHNFISANTPDVMATKTSRIKLAARLAELLADLRAGRFHPVSPQMFFPAVAKKLVLHVLAHIDEAQECPLCDLGHIPGEDAEEKHGCPLVGFEHTTEANLLQEWAERAEVTPASLSLAERALDLRTQLEAFELECEKAGYRDIGKNFYTARLRVSEGYRALTAAISPAEQRSEIYCGHANEVPHVCPCPDGCACKKTMCR